MTHLNESELVDLIEGELTGDRARHAEACAACRTQAESLGAVLRAARFDDVPEPSPLFWDHLSARIAEGIARPARPGWTEWIVAARMRLAFAAVALVLVAGVAWRTLQPGGAGQPATEQAFLEATGDPETLEADAWQLVEAAADDLDLDDLQALGIDVNPGGADRMVLELTEAERVELARLLEDEMKRTGA
jgi:hypothetical protein